MGQEVVDFLNDIRRVRAMSSDLRSLREKVLYLYLGLSLKTTEGI